MKKLLLFIFSFIAICGFSQQRILLLTEDFETHGNSIDFTTGGVGAMSGTNKWIIDSSYNGLGIYPNTTPEDSVVSGTITNAPHSSYLHVYDATSAANNCNWNESNASDQFCFLSNSFCSLAMDSVTFAFFWVAGGDTNSYGQLYYKADGRPWTPCGRPKYYGQKYWLYEQVTDTAFNNKQNLQFGFRWINTTDTVTPDMSWGIDDILAVGVYENITNPIHIKVKLLSDSVCQNEYVSFQYKLSQPVCDGNYEIEILNSAGQVVNGPGFPTFPVYAPTDSGFSAAQVSATMLGNCFHIVLVRVSPQPTVISDTSLCFSIIQCPSSIFTYSAPVMMDSDTTCIQSEIDVLFYSFGTFNTGNTYYAQLSDSSGSFAHPFQLGSLRSSQSYQGPPGDVSGVIPANVPPGCGYYIRVISSNPRDTGNLIGPFCLKHCDMMTNNITDLQYCIRWPNATDTNQFIIQIHHWDSLAHYDTCNNFTIQLLDMQTFSVVNTGGLGVYHVNHSDTFQLIVGPYATLPVAPGTYYMRILSNCSSDTGNQTGTVIRITIGAPNPAPAIITPIDTAFCSSDLVSLYINPYNFNSQYQWISPQLNFGQAFLWPYDPLQINFTGANAGLSWYMVEEINYNCPGPWSSKDTIFIITRPNASISGAANVCFGDTSTFYVDYLPETYYTWTVPPGVNMILQGNSQVSLTFDSNGTYTISNYSLNHCGSDSGSFTFTVSNFYSVQVQPPVSALCLGDSVVLMANTPGVNRSLITIDSSLNGYPGAFFNIFASDSVVLDSFACKILGPAGTQATIDIYEKSGTYVGFEQTNSVWNLITVGYPITTARNQMVSLSAELGIPMSPGDTLGFYLIDLDQPKVNMAYSPPHGAPPAEDMVYATDGNISYVQGAIGDQSSPGQAFGPYLATRAWNGIVYYHTLSGLHYFWNTGDTTQFIKAQPQSDSTYWVKMFDNGGCGVRDSGKVTVNQHPTISLGPDTVLCENDQYQVPGLSNANSILWSPDSGLSNAKVIAPVFKYAQADTFSYTVFVIDTTTGCNSSSHLTIGVMNCSSYIQVPQAFSPNGDGIDDHFTLFGSNIAEYDIKIYNRWGEMVYQSGDLSELSNLNKGWDGTYQGKPQNIGTFVYYLNATDIHGKAFYKKGNITLLK